MNPATQNAPIVGNLASAFWTALVLYAASFITLPGDETLANGVELAAIALLIALPVWLAGRFTQKRLTDPKPQAG